MKNINFSMESKDILRGELHSAYNQTGFLSNLKKAIENNRLSLHYQPRFNVLSSQADILEALVRWYRPGIGHLCPEAFISDAEENGLIFGIDLWVFKRCCQDLKRIQAAFNPNLKIAVNLSVLTCESLSCAQKIIEISKQYDTPLSNFEFEITENAHTHDIRKVIAFCTTLKEYGAEFSLDDFGTGQSPLVNLHLLPASTVKIDRCFIQGIGNSKCCEIIIRSLVNMTQELGMQTVAEGIENDEQYWYMRDTGCDQLQGYLLCRPTDLNKLTPLMLNSPNIRYPNH